MVHTEVYLGSHTIVIIRDLTQNICVFFSNAFTLEIFPVALNPLENVTNKKRQKYIYIKVPSL